jgi:hypothetical protein
MSSNLLGRNKKMFLLPTIQPMKTINTKSANTTEKVLVTYGLFGRAEEKPRQNGIGC